MFEYFLSARLSPRIITTMDELLPPGDAFCPMMLGEHCMECAAPLCYATCPRFNKRADGHCERFHGGLIPVVEDGRLGTQVHFKSWSKLETTLEPHACTRADYLAYCRQWHVLGLCARFVACCLPTKRLKSLCFGALNRWMKRRQTRISTLSPSSATFRCTLVNRDHATQLLLDTRLQNYDLHTRTLIDLPLGEKSIALDIDLIQARYLCLHPVNAEEEVCITLYHAALIPATPAQKLKVKCVIWDLDHTLWKGILVENPHVELRRNLVQLIRELDARGIVNSIASKNNEEQARAVLREMGIEELFVFCKINWQPKSINIRNTISEMNINANTVVFVDDSPFERDEVSSAIAGITCLDPAEIEHYSRTERFQVPLSAESAGRRQTYRQLEKMVCDRQHWKGNIDSFLLACNIRLEIFRPADAQWDRCYELVQRTNQLNASGRRLSREEILAMGADSRHDCLAMQSSDQYGAYGLVGFMIVENRKEGAVITDFVISCRVARKKIEQTLVNHLAQVYGGQVFFTFKATKANHPMKELIEELGMTLVSREGEAELYRHSYKEHYPAIVRLSDRVFAQPASPSSEQDA